MATNISKRRKQINNILEVFYQKPMAKASLELFLTLGLTLFLAIFAIQPTLLTMSDLLKEIEDKRELDNQLAQKIAALSSVQTEYLSLEPRLNVLDEALPVNADLITTLKIVEKIAADSQILITGLSVSEIPQSEDQLDFGELTVRNLSISLNVIGDYQAIQNFAAALGSNRRTLVIDTIVFSLDEDRGRRSLRASITLNAPYFGPPPPPARRR